MCSPSWTPSNLPPHSSPSYRASIIHIVGIFVCLWCVFLLYSVLFFFHLSVSVRIFFHDFLVISLLLGPSWSFFNHLFSTHLCFGLYQCQDIHISRHLYWEVRLSCRIRLFFPHYTRTVLSPVNDIYLYLFWKWKVHTS